MGLPKAIKVFFIAVVYFVVAVSSLEFSFDSSNASPVWPASGIAFAVLLLWGPQVAWGIFIGAFSANLFVFLKNSTCSPPTAAWVSILIAAGNTLEALAGYYLIKKLLPQIKTENIFKNIQPVIKFVAVALVMCLASSTIGATSILVGQIIEPSEFLLVWFTWWTGDVSGILLLTPFVVVLFCDQWKIKTGIQSAKISETIIVITALVLISGIVFMNWFGPNFVFSKAFIVTPFLIWAAIRLEQKIVLTLVLFSAFTAIIATIQDKGPFVGSSLNESLLSVEVFVSISAVMVLLLHTAVMERQRHEFHLKEARDNLEEIVLARTKELHDTNAQLKKRNSELALFSFSASHDLREPLRKIEFFSKKILETENNFSEQGKNLFKRIGTTTARMNQLIENLLSYSLLEDNEKLFTQTDLNVVLNEVKNDLSVEIQQTGAVIKSSGLPIIRAIPFQMAQLFTNILSNSLKFRKPNTPPQITIESEIANEIMVEGELRRDKRFFHLTFSDNGIGFEKEYTDKVFDMLQKLHGQSEYDGSGIGLAICKKVAENHKGFISADSELGKGTILHIYLPVDEAEI